MGVLRDRVLQNKQDRTTNDLQADGRVMRAQLRNHKQLSGKRKTVTVPAAAADGTPGTAVVIHGLGYVPRGFTIELGDNNAITLSERTKTQLALANAATAEASLTLWIY